MKAIPSKSVPTYQRLMAALKPHLLILGMGLLAAMLGGLVDSGLAWLVKPIVNKGFVAKDMAFIQWIPLILIGAMLIRSAVNFTADYCITRVGRALTMEFRQKIFNKLLRLPVRYFDQQTSGKLLSTLIYNVEQIAQATTNALLTLIKEGFLLSGMIFVMLILSWKLFLFFLVTGPVVAFILRKNSRYLRALSRSVQDSVGEVTHIAEEAIEGYKVIRTFGGARYEKQRFDEVTELNRRRELKVVVANALGSSAVQIALTIPAAIILYLVTSSKYPQFNLSAGTFAAFMAAMLSVDRPFRRISGVNTLIQKGLAAAQSIFELLDQPVEEDQGGLRLEKAEGKIEYRNVVFSHINHACVKKVLNGVSFTANPGETIALVGRSGAGKSTLVNLLPRFYELDSGEILLDGANIKSYDLSDLRSQFAMVSQSVTLFNVSVADNIRYGQFDQVSDEQVIEAAKAAHAMEFIESLPQGIHTIVGENGRLFSGGQCQRIAIARALLKKAPILILDEATSSLDNESEQVIQDALRNLMQNCTTLVIAHRLSTVEHANWILVLDQGSIVEQGTHLDLMLLNGVYAQLYQKQFNE